MATTPSRRARALVCRQSALLEHLEERCLLSAIPLPVIPNKIFNVTTYGAVGDGATNDTTAIQSAVKAATAAGGGIVYVPAGTFLSGPIALANNIELDLASGATLEMEPNGVYPSTSTAFITTKNATNVEIAGFGTVDGQGSGWWGQSARPDLVKFSNCNIVEIKNVRLQNSPKEHLVFSATNNVTINAIAIVAPETSPNTDGIDPAGSNYLIENCFIFTGDDDIAIKPQSVACNNITITNDMIGAGHGISIGGQTNDGLNGLTVSNVVFNGTTNGLRLKAGEGNGGLVQNVTYTNIRMTNVAIPIYITSWYVNGSDTGASDPATAPSAPVDATTPIWQNITFNNISATGATTAGIIYGLPQEFINAITFKSVRISAETGMEIYYATGVSFTGSIFTIASGPKLLEFDATVAGSP